MSRKVKHIKSLNDFGSIEFPPETHKFKHRIIVKRDSEDFTRVLTAFPVINNEIKKLIAFVNLK